MRLKHREKLRLARRLSGGTYRVFETAIWFRRQFKIMQEVEYREEIAKQKSIEKHLAI